jgi:hypothetical protein
LFENSLEERNEKKKWSRMEKAYWNFHTQKNPCLGYWDSKVTWEFQKSRKLIQRNRTESINIQVQEGQRSSVIFDSSLYQEILYSRCQKKMIKGRLSKREKKNN